jgi:peptidyl-prolyl cis-trans isomerase C
MNTFKLTFGATLCALLIIVAGCNQGGDSAVIAKINRQSISASDFKKQMEELAPQMQQAVVTDAKARKEFLNDLVGIELVLQEAKRQGLDKDPDFKKRQESVRKEMEKRIQDDTKNELFNAVLKKELGDKMSKVPQPTDQDVKDYYNKNKDKIKTAAGKAIPLKEIEPQLKMRILQERRRDIYVAYANDLKAKAKITIDDKALDASAAAFAQQANEPIDLSNIKVTPVKKEDAAKKDEAEKKK